jgi:Uma2 family endonuclease
MTLSWPNHLLTLAEWEALPEAPDLRLELAEGVLVMSPQPMSWHLKAVMRLSYVLDEQLPIALTSLAEAEVVIADNPPTLRVPDIIVTRTSLYERNPARYDVTDGTRRVDQVLKFSEYAEAGIPQYWIIDVAEPTTVLSYVLVEDAYELSGEYSGMSTLEIAGNPVTIDLSALTQR